MRFARIWIPGIRTRSLNVGNRTRGEGFSLSKIKRDERAAVHFAWCDCFRGRDWAAGQERFPIKVTLIRVRPNTLSDHELDEDNLVGSFKAIRDQVALELGLPRGKGGIADDSHKGVHWRYRQTVDHEYGVVIIIDRYRPTVEIPQDELYALQRLVCAASDVVAKVSAHTMAELEKAVTCALATHNEVEVRQKRR